MDISSKRIVVQDIAATTGGNLNISTGTFTLGSGVATDTYNVYRITGSPTLASDLDIVASGTLLKNLYVEIYNEATITLSGNEYTIFGKTVPAEYATRNFKAECLCDGKGWSVNIFVDGGSTGYVSTTSILDRAVTTVKMALLSVTTAIINDLAVTTGKIADGAVTTAKILDANITTAKMALLSVTTAIINDLAVTTGKIADLAVTAAKIANGTITATQIADRTITPLKLSANANRYTRDIAISFETAAQVGVLNFIVCQDCTIDTVSGTVMSPFLADTGTVVFKNNAGTVMTGSQIDFTTGLVLGNQVTNTVTANNAFTAGQKLTMELSKTTTTSGKANISLCITKV